MSMGLAILKAETASAPQKQRFAKIFLIGFESVGVSSSLPNLPCATIFIDVKVACFLRLCCDTMVESGFLEPTFLHLKNHLLNVCLCDVSYPIALFN